ncbi:MAG: PD-(D/E)XK nuclease family protein [Acidobacteriota bacterium]|nr:PD-(D/E)XK nuclease family protein [Acidobacteriota bacterium]
MRLIRGAPGAGKTALVFREFKEALRAGATNLRIVVPTATLVRHFQHELARDGAVFSPHAIVSLNRFAAEYAGKNVVPDGLLRAFVREALQRLRLPEFAAVATTEGMTAAVVETVELFENAGCTPDKLASVGKLGAHARAFGKLWRAVRESVVQAGYPMRPDWLRAAAAHAGPMRVWMDGFASFSPVEQEFIGVLAKTCELTLIITDDASSDEIRKFCLGTGAKDRLLSGASRKPGVVHIAARNMEREVDEIARRILLLHDSGTEFREIGIALRETAGYLPLLRGAFDRFGIPARFYFGTPLRKHPAALFLSGLVGAALSGWDFETTLETLRQHPRWGARADFDRFDFAVREAMPGRGAAALLSICDADWLREDIAACLKIESWVSTPRKPAEWLRRLESLAASLYRPGQMEIPRDLTGIEAARSHVAAVRAWVTAISSVGEFWPAPEEPISLAEFWRVASIAIETATLHTSDDRADIVHVMNVYEARQWDFSCLFVCGLTDRDFPRQPAQNLLFPKADFERLRAAGIPLRKADDQENEERWLFASLRSRAADALFFTWPEHDSAGKSAEPSRLLDSGIRVESALLCYAIPKIEPAAIARPGRIVSPLLHAEMARLHRSIGLTALEDLAQCRFKFFSGKTLSLKASPERPAERLNPRVTGSILHVALERWLADKGRDFVELFEQAFEETCRAEHLQPGYKLEVERIRFREIAQRVSANDRWNPDSSEAEVALNIDFPGSTPDTAVTVKCRIDRLDRFGNDCVIVDYKSSKTANVEKLVASTTRLQGPLYALAVRENLHLNPVGMVYWAVREDERFGWGKIPGVELELNPMPANWADDARARTVERLSGFLSGQVHAHPEETEPCRWCDFVAACRVETSGLIEIKRAAGGTGNA